MSAYFCEWVPKGLGQAAQLDVGNVNFGLDSILRVEVSDKASGHSGAIAFSEPLSVRIGTTASLTAYWTSGFTATSSTYVADESEYLAWLKGSSEDVYSSLAVRHYAVFSDDVCVEVLCVAPPTFHKGE